MSYFLDDDASQIRELKDRLEKLQSDFLSSQFSVQQENVESGQSIIPGANPSARGGGSGSGISSEPQIFSVKDYGDVSLATVNVTADTHNIHKMRLTGDIAITINSTLAATKFEMLHLHLVQDGTGGHSITSWTGVNGTPSIDATPDSVTTVSLFSLDSGVTWWFVSQKGGVISSGSGDASLWSQFPALQDIDFATFDGINIDRLLFDQAAGSSLAAGDTGITSDIVGNLNHNVPASASYVYKVNDAATNAFQIGATSVLSQTISPMEAALDDLGLLLVPWRRGYINDITVGGATKGIDGIGELAFVDNTATPAAALSIYSDGTDLFANTGGSVKNLSDIGGGNIVDLIANEPVVTTNLTIFDDFSDMIINLPTASDVLRIRQANSTPSIASFSSNEIAFEENLDMNANFIDNVTKLLLDASAIPTLSRQIAGTADGMFIGVPSTEEIIFGENAISYLQINKDEIYPSIANAVDLGIQTTNPFKNLYLAGEANILGNLTIGGNTLLNGNTTLGVDSGDAINFIGTINSDVDFGDNSITDLASAKFNDGLGNLVGEIRGFNASPDILEIKLGTSSDFTITDNGAVRLHLDNVFQSWDFQNSNIVKLPQETQILDRTTAPSTPSVNQVSLYVINSSGAQSLRIKFDNGTEKTIATDV